MDKYKPPTQGWFKPYKGWFKPYSYSYADGNQDQSERQSIPQYYFRMPSTSHQHRVHTDITGVGSNIRTAAWIRVRDTGLVQTLQESVQTYWTAESETKHPTILFSNDKYKPPTGSQTLQGSVQTYWTAESETKHSTQLLSNYKPPTLGRFKHYTGQQSASVGDNASHTTLLESSSSTPTNTGLVQTLQGVHSNIILTAVWTRVGDKAPLKLQATNTGLVQTLQGVHSNIILTVIWTSQRQSTFRTSSHQHRVGTNITRGPFKQYIDCSLDQSRRQSTFRTSSHQHRVGTNISLYRGSIQTV